MKLPEITQLLTSQKIPFAQIGTRETGRAIVIEEGARVLAASAPGRDENILWNHPANAQAKSRAAFAAPGIGGMGGIRLWQSPEQSYMWKGTPDPATFSNYETQSAMDPGAYQIEQTSASRCVIFGTVRLKDYGTDASVEFTVRRIVEIGPAPEIHHPFSKTGLTLRFQNHLTLTAGTGTVDLWHLMQLPPKTISGAFVRGDTVPQIYFNAHNADGWKIQDGAFTWETNGKRMSKIGLPTSSVVGGPFAIREHDSHAGVYLWNIPNCSGSAYVDSPPGASRHDQLIQYWDGFDFCEVEYHSPGATPERPEVFDSSELTYLEVAPEQRRALHSSTGIPL